jgi:hypothetical protein
MKLPALAASLSAAALSLLACQSATKDTGDTAVDTTFQFEECSPQSGEYPLSSGAYFLSTDEALYNNCENEVGNGYHIHVGEDIQADLTADGDCVTMDADGLLFEGTMTDTALEMLGYICTMRITATLTGTISGTDAFDYVVEATAEPLINADACEMMIGDTEGATFPYLPCDYSWRGQGWK